MRGGYNKSRPKDVCIDFRTWLNGNKIDSNSPMIEDLRVILDKHTFRYIKQGGLSIDDVLIRMKEDGWVYEDDNIQTQLDHNTFFEMLDKNPITTQYAEWIQEQDVIRI